MILSILLLSIWTPPTTCTVTDGDTLKCCEIGRVRLLGIDAPETPGHCRKGRTCAPGDPVASKKALEKLVARGVTISPVTRDRYGRTVAQVYAGDKNPGLRAAAPGTCRLCRTLGQRQAVGAGSARRPDRVSLVAVDRV